MHLILSFLTITDNLKMYEEGKENAITLKNEFPNNLHGIKIIQTIEVEIKKYSFLQIKNSPGHDEIKSKIPKVQSSISTPLNHVCNHSI